MALRLRLPALFASTVLCLTGCFVFNNPWDGATLPGATFQIVVTSSSYGGTYVWTPQDNAYEAPIGSTRSYVYMDASGFWHLASPLGNVIASSTSPYGALPPTSGWTGSGVISGVDDSAGGVSAGGSPGNPVSTGQILQVAFVASSPGNSATYQWVSSPLQNGSSATFLGTGSTYTIQLSDSARWIHVIVTPTDSTGRVQGTPVASQPVYVP
jgi:hypothetical protein